MRHTIARTRSRATAPGRSRTTSTASIPTPTSASSRASESVPTTGRSTSGLSVWLPGGGVDHVRHVREQREMIDTVLEVGGVRYEMLEPARAWRLTADCASLPRQRRDGRDLRCADAAHRCRRSEPRRVGRGERLDPPVGRQGAPGAGRSVEWLDRGRRRAPRARRGRARKPRQVVGAAALGRTEDVALVLDQHRRRHPLRRHRHRDRRRATCTAVGCGATAGRSRSRSGTCRPTSKTTGSRTARRTWSRPTRPATTTSSTPRSSGSNPDPAGIRPNTTIVNEGLARWTYEGRTGTGISEYLHQLDADAKPVVPIV